mmetsp:Transcript_175715/g.558119  ORF Transcript_175715/g.558119 Transcript_175715/m.558119 type:complete len:383 (+) Transcript_175715:270-1418(+)
MGSTGRARRPTDATATAAAQATAPSSTSARASAGRRSRWRCCWGRGRGSCRGASASSCSASSTRQHVWQWKKMQLDDGGSHDARCGVTFLHGDVLAAPQLDIWAVASTRVLLVHGTCFGEAMMAEIGRACHRLRHGTFVVSVSRAVPSPCLQVLGRRLVPASWGDCTIYYQWRVGDCDGAVDPKLPLVHAGADDNTSEQVAVRDAGVLRDVVPLLARGSDSGELLGVHAACLVAFAAASEESARALVVAVGPLLATLDRRGLDAAPLPLLASTLMALNALAQRGLASHIVKVTGGVASLLALLPRREATERAAMPAPLLETLISLLQRCVDADAGVAAEVAADSNAVDGLTSIAERSGGRAFVSEAAVDSARAIVHSIRSNE